MMCMCNKKENMEEMTRERGKGKEMHLLLEFSQVD